VTLRARSFDQWKLHFSTTTNRSSFTRITRDNNKLSIRAAAAAPSSVALISRLSGCDEIATARLIMLVTRRQSFALYNRTTTHSYYKLNWFYLYLSCLCSTDTWQRLLSSCECAQEAAEMKNEMSPIPRHVDFGSVRWTLLSLTQCPLVFCLLFLVFPFRQPKVEGIVLYAGETRCERDILDKKVIIVDLYTVDRESKIWYFYLQCRALKAPTFEVPDYATVTGLKISAAAERSRDKYDNDHGFKGLHTTWRDRSGVTTKS